LLFAHFKYKCILHFEDTLPYDTNTTSEQIKAGIALARVSSMRFAQSRPERIWAHNTGFLSGTWLNIRLVIFKIVRRLARRVAITAK